MVALAACGLLALAQQAGEPTIRIAVDLVQLDAVVTGRDHKIVRDLSAADFEVLQDGKPQKVAGASFVELAPPGMPAAASGPMRPPALRAADVRRTIAIVVDDLNLSHASTANVRQGLRKFVEKGIAPGTMICILRTGSGSGSLQAFTSDQRQLLAMIDSIRWNPRATAGADPLSRASAFHNADSADAGETDARLNQEVNELARDMLAFGSAAAIEWALRGVRSMPGRKSLVVVTEGIPLKIISPTGGTKPTRVLPRFQRLVADAHRAGIVFHTIHPGGLLVDRSLARTGDEDALAYLASQTGGRFFFDRNFLENDLAGIAEAESGYYLIGYRPPEGTFDGKQHKIEVRVRRSGLTVRSRRELLGEESVPRETAPPPMAPRQQLARALVSPFESGGIPLRLTAAQMVAQGGEAVVRCLLHIDARAVERSGEPGGPFRAELDVLAAGVDADGRLGAVNENRFVARFEASQIPELERAGFLYGVEYSVTKPGPYQIRVAVRDVAGGRLGSASQFLEIPDRSRGRMALSSVMLDLKRPGTAAQQAAQLDPLGNPAVRRYHAGDQVSYALQLYNPPPPRSGKANSELVSEVRLYRDGRVVYQGRRDRVDLGQAASQSVVPLGGTFSLGQSMPPGNYEAEFRITQAGAPGRKPIAVASQWLDFSVE